MIRPIYRFLVCALSFSLLTGCGHNKKRLPKNAPGPVAVPARQNVSVDPALQDAARREIFTASASPDPLIRAHAMEAMRNSMGEEAAPYIVKGLTDEAAIVRFASSMAAGELRLAQAKDPLLVLSDDADASVRIGARFALHRIGDKRQSHDLEATAKDPNPRVRGDTAMVLGFLGEPTAARVLTPMLFDPSPAIRLQAAESLWRLGNQRGLEALVSASVSKFPDDQMIAVLAMAGPKDPHVLGHIEGALTSDYIEVALIAARAAGILGSDAGYGVAIKGIKANDNRQKLLAALAFGAIGRADAQGYLTPLLRDPNPDVRLAGATAILELK